MSDIYISSRYYNSTIDYLQLEYGSDIKPIVFYSFDDLYNKKYTTYTIAQGDRLDQLSYKFFGRPDMWWAIVEYNPEVQDFINLTPGITIRIPNV